MAAMRSALVMLGRRSYGSSGSSAAASVVGIGLKVHQIFRTSAPSLPLLRPSARNLEWQGLRRFSTGGMECANQRSSNHVKNYQFTSSDDPVKKYRYIYVLGTITGVALFGYLVVMFRAIHNHTVSSGIYSDTGIQHAKPSPYPYFLLPGYGYVHPKRTNSTR